MTVAVHPSLIDSAAGVAVLTSIATTSAVFLDWLPPVAAIASIVVSLLAAFWYGTQLYDRFRSNPPH